MHYDVEITAQAEQDLRAIYEYIAFELHAPENANSQLTRLENAIENLESFPERGRRYDTDPWRSRNLRVIPVDNYCVFYISSKETMVVTIIRVIYGGRDIAKQLDRVAEVIKRG